MSYITEILPQLLDGLKLTVLVFILTLILSIPLGMVLAFLLRIPIVKWFVNLYVWIMRGTPLLRRQPIELLSHAVLPGVVQVPPDGQPIILMADAQTTGGYPCIASVIQADQWKLAQARPGARLRFVPCSTSEARRALQQQVQAGLRLQPMLAQG